MRTPLENLVNVRCDDIEALYDSGCIEIDKVDEELSHLLNQAIVDTCDDDGLKMFEEDMRLVRGNTLSERKIIIKSVLLNNGILNKDWLRRKLILFGGRCSVEWDFVNYVLRMVWHRTPDVSLSVIEHQLDLCIPANIAFDTKLSVSEELEDIVYAGAILRQHKEEILNEV